jgi:hypothetical protein
MLLREIKAGSFQYSKLGVGTWEPGVGERGSTRSLGDLTQGYNGKRNLLADSASDILWSLSCIGNGKRMRSIGTSRWVWALLGIALLLWNPAGICAGTPGSQSPSHPCCPQPAAPAGPVTSSCVCIDRQPAAPVLPSLSDSGPVAEVAPDSASAVAITLPAQEFATFEMPAGPPQDLSVSFHQLLL